MDTPKKTKGQIEDAIAKRVVDFYAKALGVGPRESKVKIVDDMVIVRLKGKLLPIEEHLLGDAQQGIELVKTIRKAFHEINTKRINSIIEELTGQRVISTHSDISTKTGERFEAFILDVNLEEILNKAKTGSGQGNRDI
jgi:uncharacterized protein YbcI